MKTILFISAFFLSVLVFQQNNNISGSSGLNNSVDLKFNMPLNSGISINSEKKTTGSELIDQGWYQQAIDNIEKEEYKITFSDELNAYQSPNRINNMRFIYHKDGFSVKPRKERIPLFDESDRSIRDSEKKYETIKSWNIKFKLQNVSRENSTVKNLNTNDCIHFESELNVNDNTAFIENEKIRINYRNEKQGMRQDFILKSKPEEEGRLSLDFNVETKLKMNIFNDAVTFTDQTGNEVLKYSSLNVWDASGKKLESYFEDNTKLQSTHSYLKSKIQNPKSKIITDSKYYSIVVNDEDAVYPVTIDPLSFSPHWTAEGNQINARFGAAVANAGNVNGDTYGDVIIGAPLYDNGQTDEGCVFVYYGTATGLPAVAGWQKEINSAGAQFGGAVDGAGDFNGDGYDDVIVGAKNYSNGETNEGAIGVYFGGAGGLGNTGYFTESNIAGALLGGSVSTAGRVNGDPYYEVIAGAEGYTNGQTGEGRVFVYFGFNIHPPLSIWTAEINQANASFGTSCASAGDVNNDGYSDIIVSAPLYNNGENSEGAVFVWYGSISGLGANGDQNNKDWFAESNQNLVSGGRFGTSVASAGNVNGDSYSDIIIGSRYYTNTVAKEGAVFVYYGSSGGLGAYGTPANADWAAYSLQDSCFFGYSVSSGDFNGDGYSDLIAGAYQYDNLFNNEGAAFVWYGSASGPGAEGNPSNADWRNFGGQITAFYGVSVSTAGDVNNDSYSDLIVGASFYDNGENNEGRAFFYQGSATGLAPVPLWNVEAQQDRTDFGSVVTAAGYVNGDSYADVIVGAPLYDNGNTDEGLVFVYYGSASGLSGAYSWKAEGERDSAQFGYDVGTAGDVNHDGYSDIIIGAKKYSNGESNEGKIFVWFGSAAGPGPDGTPSNADWSYESNSAGAFLGQSVASAGDVNGDGYSDVIAGANNFTNGQANEGKVFVFFGSSAGLSYSPDWTAESDQASALFGATCATAGDVNGDGYSDILVGANLYDNGNTNEGGAFLWLGGPGGLGANGTPSNADWSAETNQDNARMGTSARTAGDVNGDGYSDIITGARLYDNTFTDEGAAFVWYGSASGLGANGTPSNADWSAYGGQTGCSFGYSCSSSGDNTLDGYSDIIIGAYGYTGMINNEGAAFIWTGSPAGLSPGGSAATANWVVYGGQSGSEFGYAVSDAGDVNGDGGSDVVAGAHLFDNGQTDEGKTFLFLGSGQAPSNKLLTLNLFIQGFYNAATNLMLRDTVTVYLRSFTPPFNKIDSAKTYVAPDAVNTFTFTSPAIVNNTNYYLQVYHRNSLETWSKGIKFISNTASCDLTTSNIQAYGENEVQIDASPVTYGIYSGDVIRDGSIDLNDVLKVYNDAGAFLTGYVNSDVTGNNYVDLSDLTLTFNNANNFIVKKRP